MTWFDHFVRLGLDPDAPIIDHCQGPVRVRQPIVLDGVGYRVVAVVRESGKAGVVHVLPDNRDLSALLPPLPLRRPLYRRP